MLRWFKDERANHRFHRLPGDSQAEADVILLRRVSDLESRFDRASKTDTMIVNGSFEEPSVDTYRLYDDRIPGWSVSRDRIEIINEAYGHGFQARSGKQLLALNGNGAISQDIPTVPGSIYRLVFYFSTESDAVGPATLTVTAGAERADYEVRLGQNGYRRETLRFEGAAGAKVTRITMASTTGNEAGPLIDDVEVEATDSQADLDRSRESRKIVGDAPRIGLGAPPTHRSNAAITPLMLPYRQEHGGEHDG
ncbi:DUF642 domain-containing protein [Novosphingobium sp. RD2P27]|uniref:DUF642 domain-containing protein n=1 Tax=Novosphingobium kalidii TaxID=3230299 RepID=A0ABV2CW80_9SPHN